MRSSKFLNMFVVCSVTGWSLLGKAQAITNTTLMANTAQQSYLDWNVAIGAGSMVQAGINDGSAKRNTALGASSMTQAGLNTGSANDNIAIGYQTMTQAGINSGKANNNIAIGNGVLLQSGINSHVVENNIVIGHRSASQTTSDISNSVIIGNGVSFKKSNQVIVADGSGNIKMLMDSNGNIGIKTFTPTATLDVNGTMKLAKYTALPIACSTASDALVATTSKYTTCICNGSLALWVKTTDGTSACVW